jgi:hypothetical protein
MPKFKIFKQCELDYFLDRMEINFITDAER